MGGKDMLWLRVVGCLEWGILIGVELRYWCCCWIWMGDGSGFWLNRDIVAVDGLF